MLANVVDDSIHVDTIPLGDLLSTSQETCFLELRTSTLLPWLSTNVAELSSTTAARSRSVQDHMKGMKGLKDARNMIAPNRQLHKSFAHVALLPAFTSRQLSCLFSRLVDQAVSSVFGLIA